MKKIFSIVFCLASNIVGAMDQQQQQAPTTPPQQRRSQAESFRHVEQQRRDRARMQQLAGYAAYAGLAPAVPAVQLLPAEADKETK